MGRFSRKFRRNYAFNNGYSGKKKFLRLVRKHRARKARENELAEKDVKQLTKAEIDRAFGKPVE